MLSSQLATLTITMQLVHAHIVFASGYRRMPWSRMCFMQLCRNERATRARIVKHVLIQLVAVLQELPRVL